MGDPEKQNGSGGVLLAKSKLRGNFVGWLGGEKKSSTGRLDGANKV